MADTSFEKMNIQWFPGHMTKAQRMIEQDLKLVDAVCEILDARIPRSSRNPDIDRLAGDKPRLLLLNRIDLADPAVTARWRRSFEERGFAVLETDARSGKGVKEFVPAVRRLLAGKLAEYEAKGQAGRPLRIMEVCGTHTHEIFRLGIRGMLPEQVDLFVKLWTLANINMNCKSVKTKPKRNKKLLKQKKLNLPPTLGIMIIR